MTDSPLLSIVITSYSMDRLKDVAELLDSIKTQPYPNVETIFVAERSTELMEQVRSYASQNNISALKVLFNCGDPGLSAARNVGIKEAIGDIIAFVDDDVIPFPDWAEEMVKTYEDETIIGATGPALPLWKDGEADWLPKEFDWIISCTAFSEWDQLTDARSVWGMNMSFRKEAFALAGGFSTDIGGIQGKRLHSEEVELSDRIRRQTKKRIVFNPKVRVEHKVYKYRLAPKYIARTSYWMGYTRHGLKEICIESDKDGDLLYIEHRLLRNILTRLPLNILNTFFHNPVIAWRKTSVAVIALSSVAFGYCYYTVDNFACGLRNNKKKESPQKWRKTLE